jgi:hypothetical protein
MMHTNAAVIDWPWLPGQVITAAYGPEHRLVSPLATPTGDVAALCYPKTGLAPLPSAPTTAAVACGPDWIGNDSINIQSIGSELEPSIPARLGSSISAQLASSGSTRLGSTQYNSPALALLCQQATTHAVKASCVKGTIHAKSGIAVAH